MNKKYIKNRHSYRRSYDSSISQQTSQSHLVFLKKTVFQKNQQLKTLIQQNKTLQEQVSQLRRIINQLNKEKQIIYQSNKNNKNILQISNKTLKSRINSPVPRPQEHVPKSVFQLQSKTTKIVNSVSQSKHKSYRRETQRKHSRLISEPEESLHQELLRFYFKNIHDEDKFFEYLNSHKRVKFLRQTRQVDWLIELLSSFSKIISTILKLGDITRQIITHKSNSTIYQRLTQFLCNQFKCDKASLFYVDYQNKELRSKCQDVYIKMPINKGLAGKSAASLQMINLHDAYKSDNFNNQIDKLTGYCTKSILCVPVTNNLGQPEAVIQLINKIQPPYNFSWVDEGMIGVVGQSIKSIITDILERQQKIKQNKYSELALEVVNGLCESDSKIRLLINLQNLLQQKFVFSKAKVMFQSDNNFIFTDRTNLLRIEKCGIALEALQKGSSLVLQNGKAHQAFNNFIDIETSQHLTVVPISSRFGRTVIEFVSYSCLKRVGSRLVVKPTIQNSIELLGKLSLRLMHELC